MNTTSANISRFRSLLSLPEEPPTEPISVIENHTARRIMIEAKQKADAKNCVVIGPFERRVMRKDELDALEYQNWERQNLISVQDALITHKGQSWWLPVLTLMVWVTALGLLVGVGWTLMSAMGGASNQETTGYLATFWWAFTITALATAVLSIVKGRLNDLLQAVIKSAAFLLTLLTGFGLPLLPISIWLLYIDFGEVAYPGEMAIVLVFLRWVLVGMAAVLPALMYFLFYRQKVLSLREGFLRDVIRLNPNLYTTDDAETLYGSRVDDVYGAIDSPRAVIGTHLPILFSTLLITLGWIVVLPAPDSLNDGASVLKTFLLPQPTPVNFGFLGAYFFLLNMIFRRYVRSDLGPKAYVHSSLRLLTTMVLVWVVSQLPIFAYEADRDATSAALIFAFLVGVIPETAIVALQDFLKTFDRLKTRFPSLQEASPLSDLDGITLYDRARLLEEGIENIENLAHHSIIDLMLWTRLPTPRLVDLIDQAILYLHVVHPAIARDQNDTTKAPTCDIEKLRRCGIRTATDLIRVYEQANKRGDAAIERLLTLLPNSDENPHGPNRIRTIIDTLTDDDWMAWLRNWHERTSIGGKSHRLADFYDDRPDEAATETYADRRQPAASAPASSADTSTLQPAPAPAA